MKQLITIDFPESLAFSLKMDDKEFKQEIKTVSLIKLYEMGKISSGTASNLLNISRVDFLDMLEKYNVSYFYNGLEDELESDSGNA